MALSKLSSLSAASNLQLGEQKEIRILLDTLCIHHEGVVDNSPWMSHVRLADGLYHQLTCRTFLPNSNQDPHQLPFPAR
jgi:hypothetical protein